jgi:predicted ATPase
MSRTYKMAIIKYTSLNYLTHQLLEVKRTTADRTYRDIVNDIVTLREDLPKNSNIEKVSMVGCSLGSDFSKNTLNLNQRGICKMFASQSC